MLDIETVGDKNSLTENVINYVLRRDGIDGVEPLSRLALNPLLSRVVSVSIFNADKNTGITDYVDPTHTYTEPEFTQRWDCLGDSDISGVFNYFKFQDERSLLTRLEQQINLIMRESDDNIIFTWNGRTFDIPFLNIRFAINRLILPEVTSNRYDVSTQRYVDIKELMTQFGSIQLLPFDLVCELLNIESPKSKLNGSEVGAAFERGEYLSIAQYNNQDTMALGKLFMSVIKDTMYLPLIDAAKARKAKWRK
jgi:DNA polymerase elongation subunit (family B)